MSSESRDEPEAATWTEADQARADLIADIACEISEDEDLVAMVMDAYDERLAALSLSAPSPDRDAIIEECAKVARRHMNIFHSLGEPDHFEIAETIEDEILALKSGDAADRDAWREKLDEIIALVPDDIRTDGNLSFWRATRDEPGIVGASLSEAEWNDLRLTAMKILGALIALKSPAPPSGDAT